MNRAAGVLLPITSLPSRYGVGCFDKCAHEFVDYLKEAGQTYWQFLPICPTSYGDSPYQSFSTFAGNPYFISLEALIDEGVLTQAECRAADFGANEDKVDYDKLYENRYKLLRKAYEHSDISKDADYQRFVRENGWWLSDYALFMALKSFFGAEAWTSWPEDIRMHWGFALDYYREKLYFDIEFQQYMQFKFYQQWGKLKAYANSRHIQIVGDIPTHAAQTDRDGSRIGIRGHQGSVGAAADVDIHTANHHGIAAGAQNIAFAGNIALLHQVGDVNRCGGPGDAQGICQVLLRDHGIGFNGLENLSLSLCHVITS